MRTKQYRKYRDSQEGSALVTALLMAFVAIALVASYLQLSTNDIFVTRKSLDYQKAVIAAEAGLEYGLIALRDVVLDYQLNPSISKADLQATLNGVAAPTPIAGYEYVTPGGLPAFKITVESDVVSGVISNGTACRGSYGNQQFFAITCGAYATNSCAGAVLKQTVQAVGLQLIRFGVFYGECLEILPGPTMVFEGPVHANGDMYVGGPLVFKDRVTTHGDIFHRRKDDPSLRPGEAKIEDTSDILKSMIVSGEYIDSEHPDWMAKSLERWGGQVMSASLGVPLLSPPIGPISEAHDIIERPLATNDPAYCQMTENEKFSNKAAIRMHVQSNGTVVVTDFFTNDISHVFTNVTLQASGGYDSKDPGTSAYMFATNSASNGVYGVSGAFYDAREKCDMKPVDIYVDRLQSVYPEVYSAYAGEEGRGVVYVTRDDPDGASNGVMPCVRLRNGGNISSVHGLSIVTDLPVYVEGNYNNVDTKPALVAGDAVTMLSKDWQDSDSSGDDSDRRASSTEYYLVTMTGNSETIVGDYNGGLENVLRFLEDWSGRTVTFRGSIIDLWYAELASGKWYYGWHDGTFRYTAPNRDWGYDNIYRTLSPPGMTRVFGVEELEWSHSTWADESW